jgi:hypothetical protein
VEAHRLALILGVVLWSAEPLQRWHLTGAVIAVLLGTSNVVFWQIFVALEFLSAGYIATGLHVLFAGLQLIAAAYASASAPKSTKA